MKKKCTKCTIVIGKYDITKGENRTGNNFLIDTSERSSFVTDREEKTMKNERI